MTTAVLETKLPMKKVYAPGENVIALARGERTSWYVPPVDRPMVGQIMSRKSGVFNCQTGEWDVPPAPRAAMDAAGGYLVIFPHGLVCWNHWSEITPLENTEGRPA